MKKMKIDYDRDNDILYISFGKPRPSYVEEMDSNFLLRYDMETDHLTGITIINFSKHVIEFKNLDLPIKIDYEEIENVLH